ncbi:hypothetical protein G7046_g4792 [Stylonectria norvegica]|nr:hypothetical protein G7046_g4792 [Stylonectria norvegica]
MEQTRNVLEACSGVDRAWCLSARAAPNPKYSSCRELSKCEVLITCVVAHGNEPPRSRVRAWQLPFKDTAQTREPTRSSGFRPISPLLAASSRSRTVADGHLGFAGNGTKLRDFGIPDAMPCRVKIPSRPSLEADNRHPGLMSTVGVELGLLVLANERRREGPGKELLCVVCDVAQPRLKSQPRAIWRSVLEVQVDEVVDGGHPAVINVPVWVVRQSYRYGQFSVGVGNAWTLPRHNCHRESGNFVLNTWAPSTLARWRSLAPVVFTWCYGALRVLHVLRLLRILCVLRGLRGLRVYCRTTLVVRVKARRRDLQAPRLSRDVAQGYRLAAVFAGGRVRTILGVSSRGFELSPADLIHECGRISAADAVDAVRCDAGMWKARVGQRLHLGVEASATERADWAGSDDYEVHVQHGRASKRPSTQAISSGLQFKTSMTCQLLSTYELLW